MPGKIYVRKLNSFFISLLMNLYRRYLKLHFCNFFSKSLSLDFFVSMSILVNVLLVRVILVSVIWTSVLLVSVCEPPNYEDSHTLNFSLNWPTGPIQSLSPNIRLSVCLCHFFGVLFRNLITPIYKGQKSNWPIAKIFLRE